MNTNDSDEIMGRNKQRIPHSALYTSATWQWGKLPCAEIVTPEGAANIFHIVNMYLFFYRILNPRKFSLRHMLLHRHTAINFLLKRSGCHQIIEIASGFSPRGCMVSADPTYQYFEVDLPEVIGLKRMQLQKSKEGRSILMRPNLTLLEGDITALDFSSNFAAVPTFVISEGIMMYFKRDAQMSIWRNIAEFVRFTGGGYVFDYIPIDDEPPRSFLGDVFSKLRQRLTNHPPPFAYDDRTRLDIVSDLKEAGFSCVDAYDSAEIAESWSLPYPEEKTCVITFHCRCQ